MPKFLVSSAALLRCLKEVAPIVKRSPLLPITANVLLSVSGNTLSVVASDLENTITTTLPVEFLSGDWATCPPIKPLMEVLKNLPDQPVTLIFDAETDKLTLNAGVEGEHETAYGASYTFTCEKAADFPRTPNVPTGVEITFPGHLLRTAFGYTAELVSNDELRPAMMCVYIDASEKGIDFIATDGHRLCIYEVQAGKEPGYTFDGKARKMLLLPRQSVKALRHLIKNDDTVTVTSSLLTSSYIGFQVGTYGPEVVVRPVDERYPNAYAVLPTEFPGGTLTLARPAARTMLNRMLPFCGNSMSKIELHFSGTSGQARAEDADNDLSAREPLPGTFAPSDDASTVKAIGFNVRFLAHLLMLLPGPRVRLSFTAPIKGCMLTADGVEGLRYVLMPVAIFPPDNL